MINIKQIKELEKQEIIKKYDIQLTELLEDNTYIIEIEVGDMPKEEIFNVCSKIKQCFDNIGVSKSIIVPTYSGKRTISIFKLKDN